MTEIENLFNTEEQRKKVLEMLGSLSIEEKQQWLQHTCTQALLKTMQADYIDYHRAWENGHFEAESVDGTAQRNAKAKGVLEAIRLIEEWIRMEVTNDFDEGS